MEVKVYVSGFVKLEIPDEYRVLDMPDEVLFADPYKNQIRSTAFDDCIKAAQSALSNFSGPVEGLEVTCVEGDYAVMAET